LIVEPTNLVWSGDSGVRGALDKEGHVRGEANVGILTVEERAHTHEGETTFE
jgi:hypothetical protein